ncbi:putative uncharacterized protein [Waddlia chondrophila 2032/99]|uniref:Uncharacterized protein n=1 Tax=Waddlia chondrophila 2032/99 TaxID=765953 RepID=F8LE63_9BACT|nr:hypothetical protein [Waddlia chondrophila]CCB91777.1 putative uncharacterized protein [Waddlia chondrophila 2032/99]
MNIKINRIGLIKEGLDKGWYVRILDDFENSGGYLIVIFNSLDSRNKKFQTFDSWVENFEDLCEYFKESSWDIQWYNDSSS